MHNIVRRSGCSIGCLIAGLIPLVIWLVGYWVWAVVIGGYYNESLDLGNYLIFIIPSILYLAFLIWIIRRTNRRKKQ